MYDKYSFTEAELPGLIEGIQECNPERIIENRVNGFFY
jgi:hypothetical protein